MSAEMFLSSVKKLSEGNVGLGDLIGISEAQKAAGGMAEAAQLYSLWIQSNANNPLVHVALFNMAVLLSDLGDLANAKQALEKSIAHNPDFYPSYVNLGTVLERMGAAGEAINQWTLLANRLGNISGPNINYRLTAFKQIGRVLENNVLQPNAEIVLKQSLEIDPNQIDVAQHYIALRLAQCEWPIVSPWEGVNRKALMGGIGPLSMSIYTDDPLLQLAAGANYNQKVLGYAVNSDMQSKQQCAAPGKRPDKLRIGYISSDLRNHAVGFIMAEMFELHDRSKYEIFAYYCGIPHEDPLKERIRNNIEHWVDIRPMSDEAAAQLIIDDKIDILIDVNGYTKDARTAVFAMRPAPIIVNWLGFPGSMGSPYHHYIIADEWIIPPENEKYFSEKVLHLPCYQPNDRKRLVAEHKPTRADMGLPEDAFVFCSFNGAQKISRFTFERWMRIMKEVPSSVLWLLEGSELINQRLREAAKQFGVAPERLIFAGKMPNPNHLARYPLADLFLDTTPYGAHVTASDALWMGVPILTFAGRSFAARVCSDLVRAAGIPEMVCADPEEFVARGIALGNDKAAVAKIKAKLEANRNTCTLFDMNKLVKHLEGLFEVMWEEYSEGNLPRPDLRNLATYLDIGGEFDHDATEMLTVADYEDRYVAELTKRHNYCALGEDGRLWSEEKIAAAEAALRKPHHQKASTVVPLVKRKR